MAIVDSAKNFRRFIFHRGESMRKDGIPDPQRTLRSANMLITAHSRSGWVNEARLVFNRMPCHDTISWNAMISAYAQNGHLENARRLFDLAPYRDVFSWSSIISAYAQYGLAKHALEAFNQMGKVGVKPNKVTYVSLLDACAFMADIELGKVIHSSSVCSGFGSDVVLGTALLSMYGKCRCIKYARSVFDRMPSKDVVAWNAMIAAYAQNGQGKRAFDLFQQMDLEGVNLNKVTFLSALDACASQSDLRQGKTVHIRIICFGFESDVMLGTALVNMYGKCRNWIDSRGVFDKIPRRDEVSWNAIISAYAQNDQGKRALELFEQVVVEGLKPNKISCISIIDACEGRDELELGKRIHAIIVHLGFESDVVIGTSLVNMYGKCGSLLDARSVFDRLPIRDVVAWNAMITACVHNGVYREALSLFRQISLEGVRSNKVTLVSILMACASLANLEQGKLIHASIASGEWELDDLVVGNALVNMYGKCKSPEYSRVVFDKMGHKDLVSWTVMIAAYTRNGLGKEALELFETMEGCKQNKVFYIAILDACADILDLEWGKIIHAGIICNGFDLDIVMSNALVSMYGKCGRLEDVQTIFNKMEYPDVVSWNALITAYSQFRGGKEALKLFQQMYKEGMKPDKITLISVLASFASSANLRYGKSVHAGISQAKCGLDITSRNALISMYGRCGSPRDARNMFDKMVERDAISWGAIISAYVQNGEGHLALELFQLMLSEGVKPDKLTFISISDACAGIVALRQGKMIHAMIAHGYWESDIILNNILITMYGKCGSWKDARSLFDRMPRRDVFSWTAVVSASAESGHGKLAIELFKQMVLEGVKPDEVTFISALSACSHAGLLEDGWNCFYSMHKDHGIIPMAEHYVCMIDLLARAGELDEVESLIKKMPFEPSFEPHAVAWMCFLNACKLCGDLERGAYAVSHITELNSKGSLQRKKFILDPNRRENFPVM